MFARRADRAVRRRDRFRIASVALVLLWQERHGVVDTRQRAARNLKVAGSFGTTGHHQHVVIVQQALHRDVDTDLHIGAEKHTLGLHLRHTAIDEGLLHLEVRDAVAKQSADAVGFLEHRGRMSSASQLLGAGQAGRTRPHHGHPFAGAARRHLRHDPALFPPLVDDGALNGFDCYRRVDNVERAGGLAWGGANAAGELRKVVGGVQVLQRRLPLVPIDQGIEVGDLIVDRAAIVAKRDATIHATGCLAVQGFRRQRTDEFLPVVQSVLRLFIATILAVCFQEAGELAHRYLRLSGFYSAATAAAARRSAAISVSARR